MSEGRVLSMCENVFLRKEQKRIAYSHKALIEEGYYYIGLPFKKILPMDNISNEIYEWLEEPGRDIKILSHIFIAGDRWTSCPPFEYLDMIYINKNDYIFFCLRWMY